ncbi:MAG: ABC transporter substrate-binding protein [Acidiferrobacterales bacterium]|nr:ABC transporter substrate-binding protein [Gammaproteobacteria bacterium]
MSKVVLMLVLTAAVLPAPVAAQGEAAPPPIRLGMTAALSGPAQSLGTGMKIGIESYFDRVNWDGGVHGRKLELIVMDDGYVPEAAMRNMHALIDEEKVLAVLGNVGTPTAKVTVPIATNKKTLLFGAFTGAGLLRPTPPNRYIVNYRASYLQETAAMVRGLLKQGILPYQIAIFTQNDAYGDAGYTGVMRGLEAAGYRQGHQLPHGRYERNTLNVEQGLLKILEAPIKPRAIIMIGAYAACAKFIRIARRALPETIYLNVSFVGSMALKNALGPDGEGVIVTQVVPHFESDVSLTREYYRDFKDYAPEADPGFVSLEGYIVARIFIEGLRRAGPDVDRESIIDALLGIKNLDIGLGTPIRYTKELYQGSQRVWPTVIRNGRFESFDFASLNKE